MTNNMDELKAMFSTTTSGTAQGFGVRFKNLLSGMLGSTDGFFANKDAALKRALSANSDEQAQVNKRASAVEATLTAKYSALDAQMSKLNSLSSYVTQQITQWNKSSG
jgi:flagellar hook-associated protein 2